MKEEGVGRGGRRREEREKQEEGEKEKSNMERGEGWRRKKEQSRLGIPSKHRPPVM